MAKQKSALVILNKKFQALGLEKMLIPGVVLPAHNPHTYALHLMLKSLKEHRYEIEFLLPEEQYSLREEKDKLIIIPPWYATGDTYAHNGIDCLNKAALNNCDLVFMNHSNCAPELLRIGSFSKNESGFTSGKIDTIDVVGNHPVLTNGLESFLKIRQNNFGKDFFTYQTESNSHFIPLVTKDKVNLHETFISFGYRNFNENSYGFLLAVGFLAGNKHLCDYHDMLTHNMLNFISAV